MKLKCLILYCLFTFVLHSSISQTITGRLPKLANQEIRLEGFEGFKSYEISKSLIDSNGNFNLQYSNKDFGMGYLLMGDQNPTIVVLTGENIEVEENQSNSSEYLDFKKGKENQEFYVYSGESFTREQALSAWYYLNKIYSEEALLSKSNQTFNSIESEISRLKNEDKDYLNSLPENSYLRWFLPIRKKVSSVQTIAQQRPEEISSILSFFRDLDYTDTKLYKSGLYKDLIESHFWLIENSGKPVSEVYSEMKISIDSLRNSLVQDEKIFNEVVDYLFDLLERHSLFEASEYLALMVLNQENCTLNNDLAKQLETYRAMKKGNIAPDIPFSGDVLNNPDLSTTRLSEINREYTLIVFAASWCPKCVQEIPQIASLYTKWKSHGIEVVTISLDENPELFYNFFSPFPFISICDYKKWDSPIVNDYYVFSTPTMYLLDKKREILLRPTSVKHMDSWVDWYLGSQK